MATRVRQQAPPSAPAQDDRSLGELFSQMTQQLQFLLRKEIELARVETKDQISNAGKIGATFGALAVVALIAAVMLSTAAAWGLAEVMAPGLAFLIVGAVFALVALGLLQAGKKRLSTLRPPTQTIQTVKGDVDEAKSAIQRGMNDQWHSYGRTES